MFSKRLIEIASLIPLKSTVVDVGCDHGLLDIYLTLNRKCKCTASDVNENCLEQAKANIKKFGLENEIKVAVSDGLQNVEYTEDDYIVIAGMGTVNILEIIKDKKINNLIVQSNTDLTELREELSDEFYIEDEKVVKERGIFYVIIKLKRGRKRYHDSDYIIGPIIKNKDKGVFREYKKAMLNKYLSIYENVKKTSLNRRLEIGRIIRILKKYC